MPSESPLRNPILVAVWPGMGHVAINAGFFLMSKLEMTLITEFSPRELFDVEHVEVRRGIILPGRMPRSRVYLWRDPKQGNDLLLFLGEAQPPLGRHAFCQRLVDFAREQGVQRMFTFAAMATNMHPSRDSRIYAATTHQEQLAELEKLDLQLLDEGNISGLNGIVLGVAAESGLRGTCLLGEMPHIFSQLPFPKASLGVLRVFTAIAGMEVDFTELVEHARDMDQKLGELLAQIETAISEREEPPAEEEEGEVELPEPRMAREDEQRIEALFEQARADRSKAYELKNELDRLQVFKEYEDRFLDLFRKE